MRYEGEKLGIMGSGRLVFDPLTKAFFLSFFSGPKRHTIFPKLNKNCDRRSDDRQTDRQTLVIL